MLFLLLKSFLLHWSIFLLYLFFPPTSSIFVTRKNHSYLKDEGRNVVMRRNLYFNYKYKFQLLHNLYFKNKYKFNCNLICILPLTNIFIRSECNCCLYSPAQRNIVFHLHWNLFDYDVTNREVKDDLMYSIVQK